MNKIDPDRIILTYLKQSVDNWDQHCENIMKNPENTQEYFNRLTDSQRAHWCVWLFGEYGLTNHKLVTPYIIDVRPNAMVFGEPNEDLPYCHLDLYYADPDATESDAFGFEFGLRYPEHQICQNSLNVDIHSVEKINAFMKSCSSIMLDTWEKNIYMMALDLK